MADQTDPNQPQQPLAAAPQQPGQFQQGLERFGPLAAAAILGYLKTIGSPRYQGWGNALTQGAEGALGTYQTTEGMVQKAQQERQRQAVLGQMSPQDRQWMAVGARPGEVLKYETEQQKLGGVHAANQALAAQVEAWLQSPEAAKATEAQRRAAKAVVNMAPQMGTVMDPDKAFDAISKGQDPLAQAKLAEMQAQTGKAVAETKEVGKTKQPSDVTVAAKEEAEATKAHKLAYDQYIKAHSGLGYAMTPMEQIAAEAQRYADGKALEARNRIRAAAGLPVLEAQPEIPDRPEPQAQPSPSDAQPQATPVPEGWTVQIRQ